MVTGKGTRFLTEVSAGDIINIGYGNYTVQCVVDNYTLTVEEALQETFDAYTLIKNINSANTTAFEAVASSTTLTTVHVINNALRNINYSSETDLATDLAYEEANMYLSLKVFQKIQSILTIYNYARTYSVNAAFNSRDPNYVNFSTFTVSSSCKTSIY